MERSRRSARLCKVELNQGEGGLAGRRDKVARRQRSGYGNAVSEFLIEIFSAIGTPSLSVGDQRLSQIQAIPPTKRGISSDHMPQRRYTQPPESARCRDGFFKPRASKMAVNNAIRTRPSITKRMLCSRGGSPSLTRIIAYTKQTICSHSDSS